MHLCRPLLNDVCLALWDTCIAAAFPHSSLQSGGRPPDVTSGCAIQRDEEEKRKKKKKKKKKKEEAPEYVNNAG